MLGLKPLLLFISCLTLSKLHEPQFLLYKMDIIIVVTSKVCWRIKSVDIYEGHRTVPETQK